MAQEVLGMSNLIWSTGSLLSGVALFIYISVKLHRGEQIEDHWPLYVFAAIFWWVALPLLAIIALGRVAHLSIGRFVQSVDPLLSDAEREVEEMLG